jgi:hypothetical protein
MSPEMLCCLVGGKQVFPAPAEERRRPGALRFASKGIRDEPDMPLPFLQLKSAILRAVDITVNAGADTSPSSSPSGAGFRNHDEPIPGLDGRTVGDFWRWAYSDVLSNRNRSIFAEYIIGVALGVLDKPRVEWDAVDLRYGGFKIEVKSSAYCQSWFQKKPSTIRFSIRKAVFWNLETGTYEGEATRSADIYVFCVHAEKDKSKISVLDVLTWEFYVVPAEILNREFARGKSLSLAAVRRVAVRCRWDGLKAAVDGVLESRVQAASEVTPK